MVQLTAGYVAGIIAFGILIAQIWWNTVLAFILAGQLKDRETAGTWTIAGRFLHSSFWPTFLTTDPAKNRGVRRAVRVTTTALPVLTLLTAVAGVVTPLGLYESDDVSSKTKGADFVYAPDSGAFLGGTSPRDDKTFTRACYFESFCTAMCPYSGDQIVFSTDGVNKNCTTTYETNATVPNIIKDIYTSGTANSRTTISNFFDIEWRQVTTQYDRLLNNGTPVASGVFRQLESFALEDAYLVVEGLVVDAKDGGIGFRNHTLPKGHERGVTWKEDILFLEPDIECADTNLTVDFDITTSKGQSSGISVTKLVLTDRGGFVDINQTLPYNDTRYDENTPDLKGRAYTAAWMTNAMAMMTLNVTLPTNDSEGTKIFSYLNSEIGREFELPLDEVSASEYQSLSFSQDFGKFLGIGSVSLGDKDLPFDNPWNITGDDFTYIRRTCQGTSVNAYTLINNTYVTCSFVRGVPNRIDEGPANIFDDGSRWSTPVYTCANSLRASIKEVTFFHNGTNDNLGLLKVQNITEKKYDRKEDEPLWGVEDWNYLRLQDYNPVWGIVDSAFEGYPNITTTRQSSFHLLGSSEYSTTFSIGLDMSMLYMNLPAGIAPFAALDTIAGSSVVTDNSPSYSGLDSLGLWLKWKKLSESASSMRTILSLIWTDYAASAMVGAKGVLGNRNEHPDEAADVQVRPTVHSVRYHHLFGIPAYILLLCMVLAAVAVLTTIGTGRSSVAMVDQRLKQTSIGRVLTAIFYPETSTFDMKSGDWSSGNAKRQLDMGVGAPMPSAADEMKPHVAESGDGAGEYTAVPQRMHSVQAAPVYVEPLAQVQHIQQQPEFKG